MKVIKKGRKQRGWAKEFTCTGRGFGGGGCGAVLLVEQKDIKTSSYGYYDGSTETSSYFRCSECGVYTEVK